MPTMPQDRHRNRHPPDSKFLYFFLKGLFRIAATSIFFLFTGFGAILFLLFKLFPSLRRLCVSPDDDESDDEFSPEDLRKLPRIQHSCGPHESPGDACVVCLSNLMDGDWCRILGHCGHKLHAECIDNRLLKAPFCPICRHRLRLDGDSTEAKIGPENSKTVNLS